ncbi:MAG: Gx transporter family protein [Clostridia bacterium]|nr:Gx transporter family protein [Clostridia bacterium]
MSGKIDVRRTAFFGVMLALALVLSFVEHHLPSPGMPGIKLGLANVVALLLLYRTGFSGALTVNVLRIVVANLLFGSAASMLYGLAGGISAVLCMALLYRLPRLSAVGVSAAGGIVHNIAQLVCAAAVTESFAVFAYAPVLLISGTLCGVITGFCAAGTIRALPNSRKEVKKEK